MKIEPTKAILRADKRRNFWFITLMISLCIFVTGTVTSAENPKSIRNYCVFAIGAICSLIANQFVSNYQKKLENLKLRNAHPAFRFHDWFNENKEELIAKGAIVSLDEAIRRSEKKG